MFADWLMQQDHPCGELVMVQLARLVEEKDFATRDALLVERAGKHLDAVLARDMVTDYTWQRGVLDTITFHHHGGEEILARAFERLASDPAARLVRRIQIDAVQFDGEGDLGPTIATLAELAPQFPRLTELAFREGANVGNPWIDGPIHIGDVTPLYAAYPRLEVFELGGKEYDLGEFGFEQLRRLVLQEMRPTDVTTIARAKLPKLAALELCFGRWRVDGIDAVFRPLLDRTIPTLATLSIAADVTQVMQYFVRAVPPSNLARHALILAFRGVLDENCIAHLVMWFERLRVLQRLEIEGRGLSTDGRRLLERTFGPMLVIR